jgi:hypothetical protein
MAHRLTNGMLNELLLHLGFEQGDISEKNHRVWRHPASGCTLLLPANKLTEAPRPADLAGVKAHLDLQGHLDEADFESFVAEGKVPIRSRGER